MISSTPLSSPLPASRKRGALRRIAAVAASLLLAAAGVVVTALPASAHDQLISTSPANGSTVATLPAQVTLTFGEVVLDTDGGTQVKVTDATGKVIDAGPTEVQDNVVSQRVNGAAAGPVTVLWRVISEDGHPVSGEFTFTVQSGTTSAPAPSSTPTATPAAASSASPVIWVVAGIVAAVVVVIVIALLVSRRRPDDAESSDDQES
ncbi:MAG TPA: copper resistance CopC family protein [Microbacterium sp.]|nr:copper resistance CopC family protein [Microbacterium sp.]